MEENTRTAFLWAIPIAVVAGLAVALYYGRKHQEVPAVEPVQTEPVAPAAAAPSHHPIDSGTSGDTQPLPPLGDSDAAMQDSLAGIFGRSLEEFLAPQDIIRHIVVTTDNLTRKKTAVQLWPVKATGGQFAVTGADEQLTLSADNFARYEPIMTVLKNADANQVAAIYRRFYPLFQQAYVELGYPEGYFNNRLITVIDHLLETPEVQGPIRLVQPGVFYQFADSALEDRSSGQKLLIRMGSDNAAAIKLRLRELRRAVAKGEVARPAN